jgi:chemotaxis protein histidine kinase CheA
MNQYLEDWLNEIDELEMQVDLGFEDLSDAFEKQKTAMLETVDSLQEKLSGQETATNLRTKLDELRVQLALGKAEGKEAYEEQKDKLEVALSDTRKAMHEWTEKADDKYVSLTDSLKAKTSQFETKLDLFKVQFALGKAEARDEWEEKSKEVREKLHHVRTKLDSKKDSAEDHWEEFTEEMGEAFGHFKKAVKGLFS